MASDFVNSGSLPSRDTESRYSGQNDHNASETSQSRSQHASDARLGHGNVRHTETYSLAGPNTHGQDPPAYCRRTDSYETPEYRVYQEQYQQEQQPVWGLAAPLPHTIRPGMRVRHATDTVTFPGGLSALRDQQDQQPVHGVQSNSGQSASVRPGPPAAELWSGEGHLPLYGISEQASHSAEDDEGRNIFHTQHHSELNRAEPADQTADDQETSEGGHVEQEISKHESHDFAKESSSDGPSNQDFQLTEESLARPGLAPIQEVPRPSLVDKPEVDALRRRLQARPGFVPHQAREIARRPTETDWDAPHLHASHDPPPMETARRYHSTNSQPQADEDRSAKYFNKWAEFRYRFREPLSEFLAVWVMITVGLSANLMYHINLVASPNTTRYGDFTSTNLCWSFATMAAVYIAGGVSGAHLSPVITVILIIFRGLPIKYLWKYAVAQFFGSFIGALTVYGLYYDAISLTASQADLEIYDSLIATTSVFSTSPTTGVSHATAFFTQFTLMLLFTIVVLALGDDNNSPPGAGMNAFIVGLFVFAIACAFPYNTGGSFNPFRDFGPRIIVTMVFPQSRSRVWTEYQCYWIWGCWLAPFLGGLMGALVYDVFIFIGGESPVNYTDPIGRLREKCALHGVGVARPRDVDRSVGEDDGCFGRFARRRTRQGGPVGDVMDTEAVVDVEKHAQLRHPIARVPC